MTTRYRRLRFHVDFGPGALFDRVRYKIQGRRKLQIHADHFRSQAEARGAPVEQLADFDPLDWELMTVEVRADKGTFVRTAWRRLVGPRMWWVVIGYRDTVATVYSADPSARKAGAAIVRGGAEYDFVHDVNLASMKRDVPRYPDVHRSDHEDR